MKTKTIKQIMEGKLGNNIIEQLKRENIELREEIESLQRVKRNNLTKENIIELINKILKPKEDLQLWKLTWSNLDDLLICLELFVNSGKIKQRIGD